MMGQTNNIEEMNAFIKKMALVFRDNPEIAIDSNVVYGEFVRIGVDNYERSMDNTHYYQKWIDNFRHVENIEVFNDQRWSYFCQFINGDNHSIHSAIKMYIPVDSSHIYETANMLFKFMADNNIKHDSKIGRNVRNDDLVVRVYNQDDAKKISDYIKSNSYIKSGLLNINPFTCSDGIIGYASDGRLSYSSVLADYLVSYFKTLKKNNSFSIANYTNFYAFFKQEYNRIFESANNDYMLSFAEQSGIKEYAKLVDLQEISKLIYHMLSGNSKENIVIQIFNEMNNKNYMDNLENTIRGKEQLINTPTEKLAESKEDIFNQVLRETVNAYGINFAAPAIYNYINYGRLEGFPLNDGIRDVIARNITRKDMEEIIIRKVKKLDIDLYVSQLFLNEKELALINASAETLNKYNYLQLESALDSAKDGNYNSFTNRNNVRNNLIKYVKPNEINLLMNLIIGKDNDPNVSLDNKFINNIKKIIGENKNYTT